MKKQVHRDIEVGIISGKLEKDGFYGEEIQLYGFIYFDDGIRYVVSENEMIVAVEFYNVCLQGKLVSILRSRSIRLYGTVEEVFSQKSNFQKLFLQELEGECVKQFFAVDARNICEPLTLEKIEKQLSGFVYWDNEVQQCMVNAYFPQTVMQWSEKMFEGHQTENIVLQQKDETEKVAVQLQRLKKMLLNII